MTDNTPTLRSDIEWQRLPEIRAKFLDYFDQPTDENALRIIKACRQREAAALLAAQPAAQPDLMTDVAIELEQQRALKIVDDVHNLRIGGRNEVMPTAFQAGHCGACEEIEHRLRTEQWELLGQPAPLPGTVAAQPAVDTPVIAYEFLHPNGHAIVDYTEHTHVGHLTAEKGYVAKPLVYAAPAAVPVQPALIDRDSLFVCPQMGNSVTAVRVASPPAQPAMPQGAWLKKAELLIGDFGRSMRRVGQGAGYNADASAKLKTLLAHLSARPAVLQEPVNSIDHAQRIGHLPGPDHWQEICRTYRCRMNEYDIRQMAKLRTYIEEGLLVVVRPTVATQPEQPESSINAQLLAALKEALDGAEYIAICKLPEFAPAAAVASSIRSAISRLRIAAAESQPADALDAIECHGLDTPEQVCFYEQDFYVLSNFSAFSMQWGGHRYPTSEHVYHVEKFRNYRGDIADLIAHAPSAHEAFKVAERHKADRRPDWDEVKVEVMHAILRAKANQHEYVRRKLLATGERELVENSWRDDFWGWGPNRDGKNMLGKLWMQVRSELRAAMKDDHQ
jgi:N-glycosidase YbiA